MRYHPCHPQPAMLTRRPQAGKETPRAGRARAGSFRAGVGLELQIGTRERGATHVQLVNGAQPLVDHPDAVQAGEEVGVVVVGHLRTRSAHSTGRQPLAGGRRRQKSTDGGAGVARSWLEAWRGAAGLPCVHSTAKPGGGSMAPPGTARAAGRSTHHGEDALRGLVGLGDDVAVKHIHIHA